MTMRTTRFGNHEAVELSLGRMTLIVVTDMGPRIAFFGPAGKNLLFWDAEDK